MVAGGFYLSRYFALEPSVVLASEDVVFSLNLSPNIATPEQNLIVPFLTGGYGFCIHGIGLLNVGGGLKIRASDYLGFRSEILYYRMEEEGSVSDEMVWLVGLSAFY